MSHDSDGRCRADEMSSSGLADRLSTLTAVGIVATDPDGRYRLTALGDRLGSSLEPLVNWATEWAAALE